MTETRAKALPRAITPRAMAPGEGRALNVAGGRYTPKVTGEDTNGAFCMIEAEIPPGTGSPPHICHLEDKAIYVLDGTFAIRMDDETFTATAGGCAFLPRGTVHNFRNVGTAPGRILVSLTPSGHERFFAEVSATAHDGQVSREKMSAICQRYGMELTPPDR